MRRSALSSSRLSLRLGHTQDPDADLHRVLHVLEKRRPLDRISRDSAAPAGTGITLSEPLTLAHPSGEAVGKTGMTIAEEQTEQSLWAEEAARLIAGTNLIDIAPAEPPGAAVRRGRTSREPM